MYKHISTFAGIGLLALGCATGTSIEENIAAQDQALLGGTATLTYTSNTATNYCVNVALTNALGSATTRWQAIVDVGTGSITSVSNALKSAATGKVTFTPASATSIPDGGTATFSFCANAGSSVRPVIKAWNMESNAYASCPTNSGLLPTKASLAVVAAAELGRWDPTHDFVVVRRYLANNPNYMMIDLSSTGKARCASGCPNTVALLGQQDPSISSFISNTLFDPQMLATELVASFNRQQSKLDDLARNNPGQLPPAHKLTMVAGPTNLGIGACGPHYVFQADNLDGSALSATQAANLGNALCFNGYGSCGSNNPYVNFVQTAGGCPSGRTCVAVDPTDGDNGSSSTTTAGSAPSYPMNRAYDPANTLLNTACITSTSKLGTMLSKCAASPSTCGYLYCIANP